MSSSREEVLNWRSYNKLILTSKDIFWYFKHKTEWSWDKWTLILQSVQKFILSISYFNLTKNISLAFTWFFRNWINQESLYKNHIFWFINRLVRLNVNKMILTIKISRRNPKISITFLIWRFLWVYRPLVFNFLQISFSRCLLD